MTTAEDGLICCETNKPCKPCECPNHLESQSASYFYHLQSPQRSWRLPKDKPVLALPRETSRCPRERQLWRGTAQLAPGTAGLGHKHIQLGHPAPATRALQLCDGRGRQDPRDLAGRGLSAHIFKLFHMQKREGENWVITLEREEQLLQHVGWSLTGGILQ